MVLGDELKTLLTQHFQRLSELEKQVMSYISSKVEPAKAGFVCVAPDFQSVGNQVQNVSYAKLVV